MRIEKQDFSELTALEAEQREVQTGKFRTRLLPDYEALLLIRYGSELSSAVNDFMKPYTDSNSPDIVTIIKGLQERKREYSEDESVLGQTLVAGNLWHYGKPSLS